MSLTAIFAWQILRQLSSSGTTTNASCQKWQILPDSCCVVLPPAAPVNAPLPCVGLFWLKDDTARHHQILKKTCCYRAALYVQGLSCGKGVRPSVCLSVCPSHAWIVTNRTKVLPTFLYRMKGKFIYIFGHEEWLAGDAPFYLKFCVKLTNPALKTEIFSRYSHAAAQPLDLAKKSFLSLIVSRHELSNEPKMNTVRCP